MSGDALVAKHRALSNYLESANLSAYQAQSKGKPSAWRYSPEGHLRDGVKLLGKYPGESAALEVQTVWETEVANYLYQHKVLERH